MHRDAPDRPGRKGRHAASQPAPAGQPQAPYERGAESPYEWVHTAKPRKSSRTGWIIFGGIAIATVIAVVIIVVISNSTDSRKADIKQLTTSILVDRSSFPVFPGARFVGPKLVPNPPQGVEPIDPPECSMILQPKMSQAVTGGLTDDKHILFTAQIALLTERPDIKGVVSKCGSFRVRGITTTVTQRSLRGLPKWATAIQPATSGLPRITGLVSDLDVMGYYRGVFIQAGCRRLAAGDPSQEDIASLVKIFNDQVARLEAAP